MLRFLAYTTSSLILWGILSAAHADTHGPTVKPLPKYQEECASCHIAYPVSMLPAASWQRIVAGLQQHYGTDASLDERSKTDIGNWLAANAGGFKRVRTEPPQDRITRSDWFLREHRAGEVPPAVWQRASVKSPANCAACHPAAAKGDFNEHAIRIPK